MVLSPNSNNIFKAKQYSKLNNILLGYHTKRNKKNSKLIKIVITGCPFDILMSQLNFEHKMLLTRFIHSPAELYNQYIQQLQTIF